MTAESVRPDRSPAEPFDPAAILKRRAAKLSECLTAQFEKDYPWTYERAYWLVCGVTDYVAEIEAALAASAVSEPGPLDRCDCGHPRASHLRHDHRCMATVYDSVPSGDNAYPCQCRSFRAVSEPEPTGAPYRTVIETEMPIRETLDACLELAEKVEYGTNTPTDDLTLIAHLRVLREDLDLTAAAVSEGPVEASETEAT